MSTFAAVCLLLFGIAFIVGAVPVAAMMACFACDSGKPNRRMIAFVVVVFGVVPIAVGGSLCWAACKTLF